MERDLTVPNISYMSRGEVSRQARRDVQTIFEATKSLIKIVDGELPMHPGYAVIIADPVTLGKAGDSIDKEAYVLFEFYAQLAARGGRTVHNPYTDAIGASLPKKGIMLLNHGDKCCVIHAQELGGFCVAGIRYGGNETQQRFGGSQYGYLQAVPVTLPGPPTPQIATYAIVGADQLHPLGTIIGGSNGKQWSGRYFAAHFVMGLFLQDLYHGEHTDLVSIGNPYFDTSKGHLPHTHYTRVRDEPAQLEEKVDVNDLVLTTIGSK